MKVFICKLKGLVNTAGKLYVGGGPLGPCCSYFNNGLCSAAPEYKCEYAEEGVVVSKTISGISRTSGDLCAHELAKYLAEFPDLPVRYKGEFVNGIEIDTYGRIEITTKPREVPT